MMQPDKQETVAPPTEDDPKAPAEDTPKPEGDGKADPDPDAGAKSALAAERKARKEAERELARLRDAEKERERASMSEAEREKARAAELEAELTEYRTRALRSEIAAELNVPPALTKWLRGADEEAMRADAAELLKALEAAYVPRLSGASPDDTGAGKRGQADERTPQELAAEVMRR